MKNIIEFYRDCYFADKSRKFIRDIFNSNTEHIQFIKEKEDLINGVLSFISVDNSYANEVNKRSYLYRKEKEIAYASVFLLGIKHLENDEKVFYCSPLFFQTARLIINENDAHLELVDGTLNFNDRVIEDIVGDEKSIENINSFAEDLLEEKTFKADRIPSLTSFLEDQIPDIDVIEMNNFPNILDEKELKSTIRSVKRRKQNYFKLIPCSCICLLNKQNEARAVVDELSQIANKNNYSSSLYSIFKNELQNTKMSSDNQKSYNAAILSNAQERIIKSAANETNTLLVGPPGTGKSFTIATLAMEQISKGKKVLLASKMQQALDVISEKINEQLNIKGSVVKGGKNIYQKELKNFLKSLLQGMYSEDSISEKELNKLEKSIDKINKEIESVENVLLKKSEKEIRNGKFISNGNDSFFSKMKEKYIIFLHKRSKELWSIFLEFENLLDKKIKLISKYLELSNQYRITNALSKNREILSSFLKGISSRSSGKKEDIFKSIDFNILLEIFPIWLVNINDISKVLPLEKEMFDIAIIDEATQCDIASCIPIMQRAKKTVLAGDPKQLKHISFLSKIKQLDILEKNELTNLENYDYREKSILNLYLENIKKQENVVFLNEHFRSLPEIIAFSNKEFYDSKLKIMTEKPIDYKHKPVSFIECKGTRNNAGTNDIEADIIIQNIKSIINSKHDTSSIGILSPFRKQVDLLSTKIFNTFSYSTIEKHRILVGTAHSFQGEERDYMLLSFVLDDNSHSASYRFLENENIFNVSITRAKKEQKVFYSFTPQSLKSDSILRKYFDFYLSDSGQLAKFNTNVKHDSFAEEIRIELEKASLDCIVGHTIAGLTLDICVYKDQKVLGIDLIGYSGDFEEIYSIDHYKMFKRAGLQIIPLPYLSWLTNKEKCIDFILSQFKNYH